MSDSVSGQVGELLKDVQTSLAKLNMLIENRGAWQDGIEGCRESVKLLTDTQERLQAINANAQTLESTLASARAELERWSKMHAELSAVERELRSECETRRVALEEQRAALGRARSLARELSKELA